MRSGIVWHIVVLVIVFNVFFQHLNIVAGGRQLAEVFYVEVLGCRKTPGRDPKATTLHVDLGRQQVFTFHL